MTEFDLLDAFGNLDPALLERSERRAVRRLPLRKCLIAAAAVMLLAMSALATPAVQKWINGPTMTRVQIGRPYKTADSEYFIEAFARVDLNLHNFGTAPDAIERLCIPTYFEDHPIWTYNESIRYPNEPQLTSYQGIWEKDDQRVIFYQKVINPPTIDHPAGYGQFVIDLGNNASVEETGMTIGEQHYQVYLVSQTHVDALTCFRAHIDVIWTDGKYAYQFIGEGMDLEQIVEMIQTVQPVEMDQYIRMAHYDTIKTYYTLSKLPRAHAPYRSTQTAYSAQQQWGDVSRGVRLTQQRNQSAKSEFPLETMEQMLERLRKSSHMCSMDSTQTMDGMTVHIVRTFMDCIVLWQYDDCTFVLEFFGYPNLMTVRIEECIRSLTPVEELGKLPAE